MWRQLTVLGLVLIAVALAVAVPLRGYLDQRAQLAGAIAEQQELERQKQLLQDRRDALRDPDYIKEQARQRLQWVEKGERVYRVVGGTSSNPEDTGSTGGTGSSGGTDAGRPTGAEQPWYGQLWDTLTEPAAPTSTAAPATSAPTSGREGQTAPATAPSGTAVAPSTPAGTTAGTG